MPNIKKRPFFTRKRHSIDMWKKIKSLSRQGFKRKEIEEQLSIQIDKATFSVNIRKDYNVERVNSRSKNRTNTNTQKIIPNTFNLTRAALR